MKLTIFNTGSLGNCYLLSDNDNNSLLLEAGISSDRLKKSMNYDFSSVEGCFITHEHQDHCKYYKKYQSIGIDVYSNVLTDCIPFNVLECIEFMNFKVKSFHVEHDAIEPVGFLITSKNEDKQCLFVTDSYFVRYKFNALNYIIIECNYDEETLVLNNPVYIDRLRKSHMSLETLLKFLKEQDLSKLEHLVLIHGSSSNLNEPKAIEEINKLLCGTKLTIAKKQMNIIL